MENENHHQAKKQRGEATCIHDLPNEMLLEIFEKMGSRTLKKALLVNRNWNRIISQSPSTMCNLQLIVSDENLGDGQDLMKLTRRYDSVTLEEVYACNTDVLTAFKSIGKSVTKLNLNDCIFFERDFIKLCRCFPNLESLEIRWCSLGLSPVRRTRAKPAVMKHLKKLMIYGEGWCLENLDCHSLETLALSRFYVDDQRELVKFLNAQASLKSLRLSNINDLFCARNRRDKIVMNLKFQLREIFLSNLDFADGNHLITLMNHARDCETAVIGHGVPEIVAQEAVKHFHNLTYLYLDSDQITPNTSYKNAKRNTNLKFLNVGGVLNSTSESLLDLISVYPNLENLDLLSLEGITSTNDVLWRSMSNMLPKLQVLKLQRLNIFNMVSLKFPLMETCVIDMLGYTNRESWDAFSKNNPIVSTLAVKSTPLQIFFGADVMMSVKSLQHLEYYKNQKIGPHTPFALY